MSKEEIINESNIEMCIMDAIKKYSEKNMVVDMFFWREAIRILLKKYNLFDKFNIELEHQRKK